MVATGGGAIIGGGGGGIGGGALSCSAHPASAATPTNAEMKSGLRDERNGTDTIE
jgi:hypothetical protein